MSQGPFKEEGYTGEIHETLYLRESKIILSEGV